MTKLLHKELTNKIIGIYYNVYNGTARTYPEFIYEKAMTNDLREQAITCQRQEEYQIFYKDKLVGLQRLDLFIADEVVIEIKVAAQLTRLHKAQAFSYLKVVGKEVGLLCNFGSAKPEFERLYFRPRAAENETTSSPASLLKEIGGFISPELTGTIIQSLYQVHTILGPGFIHRIYANATYHELLLHGLEVLPRREYQVIYREQLVGEIKFNHLQVNNTVLVFPVAIENLNQLNFNNLKAWLQLQKIPVGILANFYPSRLEFMVLRV